MGGSSFTLGLGLGAFLLASWVDARVGDSRPESPYRRLAHALAGVAILEGSVGVLYLIAGATSSNVARVAAVFGLFLPALVYALLAGLWMMRTLADIVGLARH